MPTIYEDIPDEVYTIPLEKVKSDLDLLQHALFTDPKDQSSWNYHEWLISLVMPIQVVAISGSVSEDKVILRVGLSHKVKDFDKLIIKVTADGSPIEPLIVNPTVNTFGGTQRDITEVWQIELPYHQNFTLFTVAISQQPTEGRNLGAIDTAQTVDGLRIFRNFSRDFNINEGKITDVQSKTSGDGTEHLYMAIVDEELSRLKELNSFESGLQLAI